MNRYLIQKSLRRTVVTLMVALLAHPAFAGGEISVKDRFDEYQKFLRHKDTHFFVDDGLPWDKYDLFIRQGEVVPGGCRDRTVTQNPPSSNANSTNQQIITVEQAVNGTTCQSLIRRGYLLPGNKIPSAKSPLGMVLPESQIQQKNRVSTAAAASDPAGYKIIAHSETRFDDGTRLKVSGWNIFPVTAAKS